MTESIECDVLIAGAGPTGMATAIALHDSGYNVQIIDKHETGLSFSRAILVNPGSLRLLEPYGVSKEIINQGRVVASLTINGPDGAIIDGAVSAPDSDAFYPTALAQLDTEKCFQQSLAQRGIAVSRPSILKLFTQKDGFVESIIESNFSYHTVRSRYLLGADGFHSTVRKGLMIDNHQSIAPLKMYSQDAIIDWAGKSDVVIWIMPTGAVIAIRCGEKSVRFAATNKQTFDSLGFSYRIEKTTWESTFDVYFAQVSKYGIGRVWLAGDAAHVHSPVGGRGMNMGIADGLRFAQAVRDGDFSAYEIERHSVAQEWVKRNRLFTEIMSDNTMKGVMGRLCVRAMFRILSMFDQKNAARRVFSAIALGWLTFWFWRWLLELRRSVSSLCLMSPLMLLSSVLQGSIALALYKNCRSIAG